MGFIRVFLFAQSTLSLKLMGLILLFLSFIIYHDFGRRVLRCFSAGVSVFVILDVGSFCPEPLCLLKDLFRNYGYMVIFHLKRIMSPAIGNSLKLWRSRLIRLVDAISADELFFFNANTSALPLYEAFREAIVARWPDTRIETKKTQISFFNRRMFAAVSFAPVRKAKDRPNPFLTITFGLSYRKESARIDVATEPFPNRWTHHVMIGTEEEIDEELLSWVAEAAEFAERK